MAETGILDGGARWDRRFAVPLVFSAALLSALVCGCDHDDRPAQSGPTSAEGPDEATTTASSAITSATTGSARSAQICLSIERWDDSAGRCAPNCPKGEVYVPATGPDGFTMGSRLHGEKDRPHRVVLTRPFCMDATEVTAESYGDCMDAKRCEPPRWWGEWTTYPKLPKHPVNKVHWHHAKAYCEYRDQSLPTEAQWEWAATGGDGRKWPWGNEPPDCTRADYVPGVMDRPAPNAGCHGGGTSAVGAHPAGDRIWPSGRIHDLAGNVWEWCLDNYAPYSGEDETDPTHLVSEMAVHVVRGGGWNRSSRGILAHYRGGAVQDYQVPGLGFRCVRNARQRVNREPGSGNAE